MEGRPDDRGADTFFPPAAACLLDQSYHAALAVKAGARATERVLASALSRGPDGFICGAIEHRAGKPSAYFIVEFIMTQSVKCALRRLATAIARACRAIWTLHPWGLVTAPSLESPVHPDFPDAQWTVADANAAEAEGWNIYDAGGVLEIGRNDVNHDENTLTFADHDDAVVHVSICARAGSELHQRALAIHHRCQREPANTTNNHTAEPVPTHERHDPNPLGHAELALQILRNAREFLVDRRFELAHAGDDSESYQKLLQNLTNLLDPGTDIDTPPSASGLPEYLKAARNYLLTRETMRRLDTSGIDVHRFGTLVLALNTVIQNIDDQDLHVVACNYERIGAWESPVEALWQAFEASERAGKPATLTYNQDPMATIIAGRPTT
jgi:hypothetical protein